MKKNHTALFLTVFAALITSACSSEVEALDGLNDQPEQISIPTEDDAGITLLNTGASPRKALRFTPEKGQKQSSDMVMKMTMEMGGVPPMPIAMKMGMDVEIIKVRPDKSFELTYTCTDAVGIEEFTSPMFPIDMLNDSLEDSAVGMIGSQSYTSRGINLGGGFNLPPDADAQFRQQMEGMQDAMNKISIPLPKQEVGVGAKWTYTENYTANDIELVMYANYELASIKGDLITVLVELEVDAEPQTVQIPNVPNASMRVASMTGIGSGESVYNLRGAFMPTEATMVMETSLEAVVEMDGAEQPTSMSMNMTMELEVLQRQ